MTLLQNKTSVKKYTDAVGDRFIPSNVQATPVFDISPDKTRPNSILRTSAKTSSGGSTAYTTDPNNTTIITGIEFCFAKDATCDIASGYITVTAVVGGFTMTIAALPVLTLTAQTDKIFVPCNFIPDKGTVISFAGNTYTAGTMTRGAVIFGYTIDD